MSTGEERTYFEDKRNLGQQRIKDTFFDYLELRLREISQRVWGSQRGCFGSCSIVSGGTDRFTVSNLPKDWLDGDGNILTLDGADGTAIYFENSLGVPYYVAVRHCLVPDGVLRNPRISSAMFYDVEVDAIGEVDEPDAVTEASGQLTIQVDSVFESGVTHAGRLATVWLRRAKTIDDSVAIERNLLVQWDGSKNYVQTAGLLGQASGAASTDVADYQVHAQGVTVRKTDLRSTSPYAFVGIVTGGGAGNVPGGYSVIDQVDVSDGINPDLQEAYTSGRTITPSSTYGGAVRIQSSDSGDSMNSLLVLDRKGATEGAPLSLTLINERQTGVALCNLTPIVHSTVLQEDEPGTTGAAGTVNLTRGGADAVTANVDEDADFVLLWDFATSGMNRLYKITSIAAAVLTLENLDGSAVTTPWGSSETGNVSILRAVMASGESIAADQHKAVTRALTLTGGNVEGAPAPLRIYGRNSSDAAEFMSNAGDEVHGRITKHGTIRVTSLAETGGPRNSLLTLSKYGSSDYGQFMMLAEMGDVSAIPIACVQPINSGTDLLNEETDCTLSTSSWTLTLNRSGVDLEALALRLNAKMHLVWVFDADDESDEGLYVIDAFTTNTFDLRRLDGIAKTFVGGSCKCSVLMPRFTVANSAPFGGGNAEWWQGTILTLQDGQRNAADLRILTEAGKIVVYDHSKSGASQYYEPREMIVIDPSKVGADPIDWPIKFLRSVLINGGVATGATGEEDYYSRDGLRIYNAGGLLSDRDTAFALVVDYGFPELIPTQHTWPTFAVQTNGAVDRGPHFRDDFLTYPRTGSPFTSLGPYYTNFVGGGSAYVRDVTDGAGFGHGCVELITGTSISDVAEMGLDLLPCNVDSDHDFRWMYRSRVKVSSFTDMQLVHGFYQNSGGSNRRWYFVLNYAGDPIGTWRGGWLEPPSSWYVTDPICGLSVDEYQWFEIEITGTMAFWTIEKKNHVANSYGGESGFHASLAGDPAMVAPSIWLQTQAAAAKNVVLDYWEFWDKEAVVGRFGNSHNLQHP